MTDKLKLLYYAAWLVRLVAGIIVDIMDFFRHRSDTDWED